MSQRILDDWWLWTSDGRAGDVPGVRQTALKERGFGCEEHESDPHTPQQIELADRGTEPGPRASRAGARRRDRIYEQERHEQTARQNIQRRDRLRVSAGESSARGDRADHAPAIFDDRAHLGTVEDDAYEHQQRS